MYVFLKIAGGNLHVQLMEYDCLEDARQLLLLLELMHDYVVEGRRKEGRGKDGRMKEGMLTKSFRN